jgi:xylulokinase
MTLVAGIDSSTQACKVVVRDAETGRLERHGRAAHPDGTEVHPEAWWAALQEALARAGGLGDVEAVAVAAQQHGCVCLGDDGEVLRPALLWNDTRSAAAASELVAELGAGDGGRRAWAEAVGSIPLAAFTVTKLRWLAEHEPATVRRTAAVCLPHDWLTWRLTGASGSAALERITTDRGDASGTGYWSAVTGEYRLDLLERAFGRQVRVPRVLAPSEPAGELGGAAILGAGTGDNAGAALGLRAAEGDVVVSIGTSGTVFAVSRTPTADPSGTVAGFADATGRFLPLVCTLNAARVLDATARQLRIDHAELDRLALSAPAGAGGLVVVPYLEGERTPDRADATGAIHGLTLTTSSPERLARAAIEGLLCGLADGLDALVAQGVRVERVLLIGGGARSEAVRRLAPAILGHPVAVPPPGEYVADGAARQAAWALAGTTDPPAWGALGAEVHQAEPMPQVREQYARVRDLTATQPAAARKPPTNIG